VILERNVAREKENVFFTKSYIMNLLNIFSPIDDYTIGGEVRSVIEKIEGSGGVNPLKGPQGTNIEKLKGKKVKKDELILEDSIQLKDMLEISKNSPEIREKLVEELKKAIEGGTYIVNVENIARKILGELEEK